MKKLVLAVLVMAVALSASAQDYKSNIFGVRAGLNISNMNIKDGDTPDSRVGFHVGVSDQILITRSIPLYLETGLYFTTKGAKEKESYEGEKYETKVNLSYLQVPVLLNYQFQIGSNATLQPFVGVYYALGVGGKMKYEEHAYGESYKLELNAFKKTNIEDQEVDAIYKRSDFGMRMGLAATFGKVYVGVGYDLGLSNINKDSDELKTKNNNFSVSLGMNF